MQRVIRFLTKLLGWVSPKLGGRLAYFFFFKSFKLKSHPLDLEKKKQGVKLDFVVAGKKTSTWYWGSGPVILLVHGWGSKGFHYRKFIDPLVQQGYTVAIPDLPGHVSSEGSSSNVLEFKATIEAIQQHFGEIYALVGHSLGAMACILFLAENRTVVRKLVVANSAAYAETIMDRYMEQIGGNQRIKTALLQRLKQTFDEDFSNYSTYNIIQTITNLPEMLVVGDRNDPEVSIAEVKSFAKLTQAKLIETSGLGHNNGLKDDKVVDQIVEFLA